MTVSRTRKSSWVAVAIVVIMVAGSFMILAETSTGAFGSSTDSQSALGRRLAIVGLNGPVDVGTPLGFQLQVQNNKGDIIQGYKGTVEFSSSDPAAVVPSSYTFVRSDNGQHVFPIGSLVFNSLGNRTLNVFDVKTTKLTGTIEIYVKQSNTPPLGSWSSPVSIWIESSFLRHGQVSIAADSLGYTAVTWVGTFGNGDLWGVFINRYKPGSGWMGTEYMGPASPYTYSTCVGIDENGNITVAWINGNSICSVRHSLADNLWEPLVVVSSAANYPTQLTMAVESHGMAVMAWLASDGTTWGIYASTRRIGNVWSVPVHIESKTGEAGNPSAAITDGGDAFVAFTVMNGSFQNVCVNRYIAISDSWLGEITLYDRAYYSYVPKVSMDRYGNAFVVWDYCDGWKYMPYASAFRKGIGWGDPVKLDSRTSWFVTYPEVSAYGNGNALVSWTIVDNISTSVRTDRYINGSAWMGPVSIASGPVFSLMTSMSTDSSGSSYVAWIQSDTGGNTSGYSVNACEYSSSVGWSTPSMVAFVDNTSGPSVAAGPAGTAIMAWNEFGSNNDVWASDFAVRP